LGVFERQVKQETILEAATKVFCHRGFGDTNMTHIAKEAKLSKGLLYFYYSSKDDLYMAVILHAIKKTIQFHKYELENNKDKSGLERLMILMERYFDFVKTYPYYQESISTFINSANPINRANGLGGLTKGMTESPYYKQIMEQTFEPFMIITKVLAQGKQDGSIHTNLPPVHLYLSIWSLMIGYEKLSVSEASNLKMDNNLYALFGAAQWKSTILTIVRNTLTTP
jgi:AcrR family transcriptional regulator